MTKLSVWLYHTVVKTSTNWIDKACANLTYKMPFHFNIIGWGPNGSSPKHHSGSQQTVSLVPSIGYPTLVSLPYSGPRVPRALRLPASSQRSVNC
jgi:hypothetical protein